MRRYLAGIFIPAFVFAVLCTPLSVSAAEGDAEPRKPKEEHKGDEQTPVESTPDSKPESKTTASEPSSLDPEFRGNPFAIHGPADSSEEFVPASDDRIPPGIRVVAILIVKGREPLAVLSLPGSPHFHFVTKGELIQVEDHAPSGKPRGTDRQNVQGGTPVYLLVRSVTAKQVEIAPRTRPQDARILR